MTIDWQKFLTLIISACGAAGAILAAWKVLSARVVRPAGRWIAFLNSAIAELSPNGGRSIFDRIKRIDISTQLAGGRVMTLMERAAHPIFECGTDGNCTYANHSLCELFGLPKDEMEGRGWYQVVHPADRQMVFDTWMACVKNSLAYECDYRIRDKDNPDAYITVRASANPMMGLPGQVIGFSGTVRRIE